MKKEVEELAEDALEKCSRLYDRDTALRMDMIDMFKAGYEAGRPKWIRVEDRKPPYCEKVLATSSNWIARMLVVARMNDDQWWPLHFEHPITEPTHWMPLPEVEEDE